MRLLHLPAIVLKQILFHMDAGDIFSLSFCSTKTRNIIHLLRITRQLSLTVTFGRHNDVFFVCSENNGAVVPEMYWTWPKLGGEWEWNRNARRTVFHINETDFYCGLNYHLNSCLGVECMTRREEASPLLLFEYLVDLFQMSTRTSFLSDGPPTDRATLQLAQRARQVRLFDATWFRGIHLLRCANRFVLLKESSLTDGDVVDFVKKWLYCEEHGAVFEVLHVSENGTEFNYEAILKELPIEPKDPGKNGIYHYNTELHNYVFDYPEAREVTRRDGKQASLFADRGFFLFFVRN